MIYFGVPVDSLIYTSVCNTIALGNVHKLLYKMCIYIYIYEVAQASIFFLFFESDDVIKTSSSVGFPGNVWFVISEVIDTHECVMPMFLVLMFQPTASLSFWRM